MPLLRVDEVFVSFGGVHALQGPSLHADAGAITGLIGPNGAGKTTLFNVITGLQSTSRGRITIDDVEVNRLPPHKRSQLGMARTFQRLEVFGSLTVRENVLVAGEIRRRFGGDTGVLLSDFTDELIELVGLTGLADERVDSVSTGAARLVEVARALATRPRLLLLDEPSSGLNEEETDTFGELLLSLAEAGLAILLVEHDVELVMRVCERIFVLDYGQIIAVGTPDEIQRNEAVQAAYLGTAEVA